MWPIPKFEFEWMEPKEFRQAILTCNDRTYGKRWKVWASIGCGLLIAYFAVFPLSAKLLVPGDLLAKISTRRCIEGIVIGFISGIGLCRFSIWATMNTKMPYYVSGDRIIKGDLSRKFPFRKMSRCSVHDFTTFLVLEVETTDKSPDLICGVSKQDFEKLREIFESHGIAIDLSSNVFELPDEAAFEEFERIIGNRRGKADGRQGKKGRQREVRAPSVRALMISVLIVGTALGFTLRQRDQSAEAFRIIDRNQVRYSEMIDRATKAKSQAGDDWPRIRGEYVAQLDEQAAMTKASIDRFVYDLIYTLILGFVCYLLIFSVVLRLIFHPVRESPQNELNPSGMAPPNQAALK